MAGKKFNTLIFVIPSKFIANPTKRTDPTADIDTVTTSFKCGATS